MVVRSPSLDAGTSRRFQQQRLSKQNENGRYVGSFIFADTEVQIYQRLDQSLYIQFAKGQKDIKICADGKVVVGNAPPTEISPSLKDALRRM